MATQFPPGSTVYVRKYKQTEVLRGSVLRRPAHSDDNVRVVTLDTGLVLSCVVLNASNQIQLAKQYARQQEEMGA